MTTQQRLQNFANEIAYPHVKQLPFYIKYENEISILIVGSVATGLCTETSDVDICLLCREQVFNEISKNTNWINGRPTEIVINSVQLHYYAISYEAIEKKIIEYDDIAFYVYGNAISLNDNSSLYVELKNLIFDESIKAARKNKAIDILIRRNRALKQILKNESDPILKITVGLEIIEHLLKTIALSDDIQFDRRKRFYTTALIGDIGTKLQPKLNDLISSLSDIGITKNNEKLSMFSYIVDECLAVITKVGEST